MKANMFNMTAYALNVFSSFSHQQRINEAIKKENEQDVPIFSKEQIEGDGFSVAASQNIFSDYVINATNA